jgi:hypothetical protein
MATLSEVLPPTSVLGLAEIFPSQCPAASHNADMTAWHDDLMFVGTADDPGSFPTDTAARYDPVAQ